MQSKKEHQSFISMMMSFNGIFSYTDLPELEIYHDSIFMYFMVNFHME